MKTYEHRFQVKAPLSAVAEFHSQSSNMQAITPPPVIARIYRASEIAGEGDMMDFTLWLPPLPMRWVMRIENVSPNGFDDRLLSGPFEYWVHHHRYHALDETTTEVHDMISLEFKRQGLWRFVGIGMWLNLPILFAYRAWKTKRLLTAS